MWAKPRRKRLHWVFYVPAFLQARATLNIDIEQVNLLIPLSDIALLVNPYQRILHFLLSSLNLRWLMHADVDRQLRLPGLIQQAEDKFALPDTADEGDCLRR